MKNSRLAASFSAALIAASLTLSAGGASASETDDLIDELLGDNPGVSQSELLEDAQSYADENGTTVEQVLAEANRESELSILQAVAPPPPKGTVYANGGGSGGIVLGSGNRVGDVFYSPASTLFVSHGHSGIYSSTTKIVEAPGTGKTVRQTSATSLKVARGAKKQTVNASSTVRTSAAKFAVGKVGKPYNTNFAFNKTVNASKYNCSQLVWAAFRSAGGPDLDSNGGFGVYRSNIRDSKFTSTYKTL